MTDTPPLTHTPGHPVRLRRSYVWTSVISGSTAQGVFFLLAGLAVLRAEDPLAVGLQLAAQSLPALALLILIRRASSRFSFRSALVLSLWVQAAGAVAFALVSLLVGYHLVTALVVSLVYATASTVQAPGRRTVMADLHDQDSRRRAMSSITAYSNGARLVAPVLAGFALATGGWPLWFLLDALLCIASAVLSVRAIRHLASSAGDGPTAVAGSTLQPSLSSPTARRFLVAFLVVCVFGFNIQVIAPLTARDLLGGAEEYAGLIVSAHTLGSLLGALAVARADRHLRLCYAAGGILLGAGLTAFMIPSDVAGVTVLVVSALAGVGRGLTLTASSTMATTWGEESDFRERLIAMTSVIFTASNLASAAVIAVSLAVGGTVLTIWVCGLGSVLAGALALTMGPRWDTTTR